MNKYSTPNLITPLDIAIVTYDLGLSNITNCGHLRFCLKSWQGIALNHKKINIIYNMLLERF